MADPRESFPVLENASGEGQALSQVFQGDSVSGKSGAMGFGFQDTNGNAVAPRLTADGRLPVTQDSAGTPFKTRGEVPAGSASGTFATVASVTVNNSKVYTKFYGKVSCRQAALFQLVHTDNGTDNVLEEIVLDSGHYSESIIEPSMEVSGGSTGTQTISLRAFNLGSTPASRANLRGNVNFLEIIS